MNLEECNSKYDVILYLSSDGWHWEVSEGGFGSIGSSKGYYNPNSAKLELIEFLKDWDGFE